MPMTRALMSLCKLTTIIQDVSSGVCGGWPRQFFLNSMIISVRMAITQGLVVLAQAEG
jgi:hypothetical protein